MKLPYRVRPQAEEEITFEVSFYEDQRAGLGWEFFASVRDAIDKATDVPESCARLRSPAGVVTRFVPVRGFPFKVVFLHEQDEIVVIAVAHDRRRPSYWRGRI